MVITIRLKIKKEQIGEYENQNLAELLHTYGIESSYNDKIFIANENKSFDLFKPLNFENEQEFLILKSKSKRKKDHQLNLIHTDSKDNLSIINHETFQSKFDDSLLVELNHVSSMVSNYTNEIRELIINENFYDEQIFKQKMSEKLNNSNFFMGNSCNEEEIYTAQEIIKKIHELLLYVNHNILEKYRYFKNNFAGFKRVVINDLSTILKRIDLLNAHSIEQLSRIEEVEDKIVTLSSEYRTLYDNFVENKKNTFKIHSEINKFLIDLTNLNEFKNKTKLAVFKFSKCAEKYIDANNCIVILESLNPFILNNNFSIILGCIRRFIYKGINFCFICSGNILETRITYSRCLHAFCKKCIKQNSKYFLSVNKLKYFNQITCSIFDLNIEEFCHYCLNNQINNCNHKMKSGILKVNNDNVLFTDSKTEEASDQIYLI